MTTEELQAWAANEVKILISCGIDPLDAQNTIKRVLAKLPEGQDPRTWLPPVQGGNVEIDESDIQDSRSDWYASDSIPTKYIMLLDASEVE